MNDKEEFPMTRLFEQAFGATDETETEQTVNVNVRIEIEVVE